MGRKETSCCFLCGNVKNYKRTAEIYEVSYQQLYQWFKKHESGGELALQDRRRRKKEELELFSNEKKRLEREYERHRA